MNIIDKMGRIGIPKQIRDQLNINTGDLFNIHRDGNKIILDTAEPSYHISQDDMNFIRQVYIMVAEMGILNGLDLENLKRICKSTDEKCEKCGNTLFKNTNDENICISCKD